MQGAGTCIVERRHENSARVTSVSELASVAAGIIHWARIRPDDVALVFTSDGVRESQRLSFGELDNRAARLGGRIARAGLASERVLLPVASETAFLSALCGCFYAGAIAVPCPFNLRHRGLERIRSIAKDAAVAAVIGGAGDGTEQLAAFMPGAAWLSADGQEDEPPVRPECPPGEPALLQYTSGSISAPKGVILSQRNLLANIAMLGEAFAVHAGSRVLTWLPLFHDMGLLGNVVPALCWGVPCVVMRPLSFLQQPRKWLEAIDRHRITISGGPNFAYELCVRRLREAHLDELDLSSWELAFCGAEPVRLSTMQRFAQTFAAAGFRAGALYPCYGLAEATVFVSGGRVGQGVRALARDAPMQRDLVSCGSPPDTGPVAVVDPQSCELLPDGREGELWVRGDHVAAGYWNNPAATAPTFAARIAHRGERFLRTGDLGLRWQGELYITGRRKNLIIYRGSNLHPEDVEASIGACHPGFGAMGAAFSVEVDEEEQVVAVYEVLNDASGAADAHALTERALDAVALEHGVRLFDLVLIRAGMMPRTTSGKVRREECRNLYLAGQLAIITGAVRHPSLGRYQALRAQDPPPSAAT